MNLSENKLITFNGNESVSNMNDFELEAFDREIIKEKMKRYSEKLNEVIILQSDQGRELIAQGEDLEKAKKKLAETVEAINVIGFGIHSKKGKILRKICAKRVHSVLGDMGGYNYLLWNSYFFKKIYNDLGNYFDVDSYKNINVKDFGRAKAFVSSWSPDDMYVSEKTQEMIEKRNKGLLSQTRCMALYAYLEETDNGSYNPF